MLLVFLAGLDAGTFEGSWDSRVKARDCASAIDLGRYISGIFSNRCGWQVGDSNRQLWLVRRAALIAQYQAHISSRISGQFIAYCAEGLRDYSDAML